jgi:glutathione S-transferase
VPPQRRTGAAGTRVVAILASYLKEAHRLYSLLDRRLAQHEFVADDYSIADIAIWPWVSRHEWQTVDLNVYANVKRWSECRQPIDKLPHEECRDDTNEEVHHR